MELKVKKPTILEMGKKGAVVYPRTGVYWAEHATIEYDRFFSENLMKMALSWSSGFLLKKTARGCLHKES
jgi:hypothetical protein